MISTLHLMLAVRWVGYFICGKFSVRGWGNVGKYTKRHENSIEH